ncbi:15550_t:CDS:2 [Rhizophagus irregularis]|nr:15550_t:CDS:2 [Rhizophagus irregularis]
MSNFFELSSKPWTCEKIAAHYYFEDDAPCNIRLEDILDNIDHVSSFKQPLDLEKDGTNPRTPEDKVAVFSKCIARNENSFSPLECVQKRTVTFEEEESSTSAMSYIPAIPVESPTSIDPSNSKSARKDRPEVQDKYETDDNDEEKTTSEDNIEWNKETCAKVAFRQSFEKIPETTKLKLSSGRVVEDLLFNYVKDNDYEDHAHSFIINCDNQGIRELFNDEEWKAFLMFHLILQKK